MEGSEIAERSGKPTGRDDDPLASLYQMDIVSSPPLEEEALVLMARMLDDVEKFEELSSSLRGIMAEDVLVETRVLSLFRSLIDGVKVEHKYLKMNLVP